MLAQYIREKGMQQGRIQKAKEDVIEVIELRFGEIPPEIINKINKIQVKEIDRFGFIC